MVSITVVVPAYNEEEFIVQSVQADLAVLQHYGCKYELIVVNDGSTDKTKQLIEAAAGNTPVVTILNNEVNLGLGGAVKKGIAAATYDAVIVVPVDSPLSIDMFGAFLQNLDKGDILASYRVERKGYTAVMKLNSIIYRNIISMLFGMNLHDYNWIHLYKKSALKKAGIEIESRGIFMLAEILVKAERRGLKIVEFPVDHDMRVTGTPSATKPQVILFTIKEMVVFLLKAK